MSLKTDSKPTSSGKKTYFRLRHTETNVSYFHILLKERKSITNKPLQAHERRAVKVQLNSYFSHFDAKKCQNTEIWDHFVCWLYLNAFSLQQSLANPYQPCASFLFLENPLPRSPSPPSFFGSSSEAIFRPPPPSLSRSLHSRGNLRGRIKGSCVQKNNWKKEWTKITPSF